MPGRFDRLWWIGPVAFFLAACAWSMLDTEYASDTWIGLASGRHIMEQVDWARFHETFPTRDVFSYTFHQEPWFNQNWFSNLGYYWIYHRFGPAAVVYATWAMVACMHVLILLAVYWRAHSWLAAWLAAALAAVGMRDFLEPRSATVGLLCTAAIWALVCAIEGQRGRRRWWPIVPLLPLLCLWSASHGGFVFGYGLLALYCGYWVAARLLGRSTAADGGQILSIAVVLIAAATIHFAISPFGIESLVHPGRVASSSVFRGVSEWLPAYSNIGDRFPPMWRFWRMLGLAAGGLLLLWLAGKAAARSGERAVPGPPEAPWSVFDVLLVVICLAMTVWARRFAPLLYMVCAPVLAIWAMRLAAPSMPYLRGHGLRALGLAGLLAAVVTGWLTWAATYRDLIEAYKEQPATKLLDRARGDPVMHEAIFFLKENRLRVNLFADWGDAGSVMFYAPLARVFIDPRGDQVYTEQHFRRYGQLDNPRAARSELLRILDDTKTDAALVRDTAHMTALRDALHSPEWLLVFLNAEYSLYLRGDSPALKQLGEVARNGGLWLPTRAGAITPDAQASRAVVLLNTSPADPGEALNLLRRAVDRNLLLGHVFYPTIVRLEARAKGAASAADYIRSQTTRIASDTRLESKTRSALLAALKESWKVLERADTDSAETRGDPSQVRRPDHR